jgi:hypothetical protein
VLVEGARDACGMLLIYLERLGFTKQYCRKMLLDENFGTPEPSP